MSLSPASQQQSEAAKKSTAGQVISYTYKASLAGTTYGFELRRKAMAWWTSRRSETWNYSDIVMIRMSYRPSSMQMRRFRTEIWNRAGQRVSVVSTTWRSVAMIEPQDDSYRAFITTLHRRVADAGGKVLMEGGLMPWVFYLAALLLVLMIAAGAGLMGQALLAKHTSGALFFAVLTALFVWQIGGFVWRNRPIRYDADNLPDHLLPAASPQDRR